MNRDLNELEVMTHEFKSSSTKLRIKHLGNMKIVEQEILDEEEGMITHSGRINI
jgi:hypothetical protein